MSDREEREEGILAAVRLYATASMAPDGMVPTAVVRDIRSELTSMGEDALIRFLVGIVSVTLPAIEGELGADMVMAEVVDNFRADKAA